jgi:hypothetical protein
MATAVDRSQDDEIISVSSYVNPFSESIDIKYSVYVIGDVQFDLFNNLGAVSETIRKSHLKGETGIVNLLSKGTTGPYYCRILVNGRPIKMLKLIKR